MCVCVCVRVCAYAVCACVCIVCVCVCVCALVVPYVAFVLSLFVHYLSFFWCFGKAVLCDCGIS